jgi:hypothetical protein
MQACRWVQAVLRVQLVAATAVAPAWLQLQPRLGPLHHLTANIGGRFCSVANVVSHTLSSPAVERRPAFHLAPTSGWINGMFEHYC